MDNGLHKFKKTKKLDRRKLQKRKSNGVLLIYWQYDEPINPKAFAKKLRRGKRRVYGVLKYNKSYIIFAACPGHYGYNFQEQFITSLSEKILYKRSFLISKKWGGCEK
ncbi:hypothetical protein KJ599_01920 [bacterium]|nr:hypothetical protein [bacterium]